MKQTRSIVITAILTLLTFGAMVYTSCRKDHCKNMNCQHGGTCNDGFCYCTTGYTGTFCEVGNISSIAFTNKTFTPVYITIGGINYKVDTGTPLVFTGSYGDTIKGTATAHGERGVNVPLAPIKATFPVRNTLTYNLNVSPDYFFVMATNNNPTVPVITQVHVDTFLDVIDIPNDHNTHYIGYYPIGTNTKVKLEKTPGVWTYTPSLNDTTLNQFYNAILN